MAVRSYGPDMDFGYVCTVTLGSIKYVILLHPTVVLLKQYTHTKCILLQRSYSIVFIMLRYIDQIKTFVQYLCCRGVKISKIFRGDLPYYALKCENLPL